MKGRRDGLAWLAELLARLSGIDTVGMLLDVAAEQLRKRLCADVVESRRFPSDGQASGAALPTSMPGLAHPRGGARPRLGRAAWRTAITCEVGKGLTEPALWFTSADGTSSTKLRAAHAGQAPCWAQPVGRHGSVRSRSAPGPWKGGHPMRGGAASHSSSRVGPVWPAGWGEGLFPRSSQQVRPPAARRSNATTGPKCGMEFWVSLPTSVREERRWAS